jgi:hypothetical protein
MIYRELVAVKAPLLRCSNERIGNEKEGLLPKIQ